MSHKNCQLVLPVNKYPLALRVCCSAVLLSLLTAWVPVAVAFAGDCDGTASNDTVNCTSDPVDAEVGLGLGDDTYTQDAGVIADEVLGDALEDGSDNTGNGGNDQITIDGGAFVVTGDTTDGNGGDDTITITTTGGAFEVDGDDVTGDGGNDTITVDGVAVGVLGDGAGGDGGDDIIIINGYVDFVAGDEVDGNGGDDTIIINGFVGTDVTGDCATLDGGNDTIIVNGEVVGDVVGDCVGGAGGDDSVIVGNGSYVGGVIDGEDGTDTLQFGFLSQDDLAGFDPNGGSLTYNGNTYTWANFEQLIGLLEELGLRFIYHQNGLAAISFKDGIKVMNENGLIAFIPFSNATLIPVSTSGFMFQSAAHSGGWFVKVVNLGTNPANPANNLFQVNIYDAAGILQGQFTFSD